MLAQYEPLHFPWRYSAGGEQGFTADNREEFFILQVRIQASSSEAQELNHIDDPGEELWYKIPSLISTLPSRHQVAEPLTHVSTSPC